MMDNKVFILITKLVSQQLGTLAFSIGYINLYMGSNHVADLATLNLDMGSNHTVDLATLNSNSDPNISSSF